jgi:hypothetical protein
VIAAVLAVLATSIAGCDQILVQRPEQADLVGVYDLTSNSRDFLRNDKGYTSIPNPAFELRADGGVVVVDLPDCAIDGFGRAGGKLLSGRGKWKVEKAFVGYGLTWEILPGNALPAGIYGGIAIRGRRPPYELELTVGDPDSGERIRYQRVSG